MLSEDQLEAATAQAEGVDAADGGPATEAKPEPVKAPPYLRFQGNADTFVSGVPQSNLKVVDEPVYVWEVSPGQALELVASGLYAASDQELEVGSPIEPAEGEA